MPVLADFEKIIYKAEWFSGKWFCNLIVLYNESIVTVGIF